MAQQPSALSFFPARVVIGYVGNDQNQPIYMSAEFYRAMNKFFTEFSGLAGDGGVDVFAQLFQQAASESFGESVQPAQREDVAELTVQPSDAVDQGGDMVFQQSSVAVGIQGGSPGQVLYQSAPNVTSFTATGTTGQALLSGGIDTPTWTTGTLSLAGNFATAGAFAVTFTFTGITGLTFPTTGTLATLAGVESLTNKKLGSLTSNGLVQTSSGDGTLSVLTPGTGVATALAVDVGTAGAFVVNGGALGTPSSGTLTNCSGLPISTGVSGLGSNVPTALAVAVGTDGAFVVKGGALGSPSAAGTMPAYTLGGTVTLNGQTLSGTATISPSGTTSPIVISKAGTGAYGFITLNNDLGINTGLGMFGGASGDADNLYLEAPSIVVQRIGSSAITEASSTGLLVNGTVTTAAPSGGAGAWKLGVANVVSPTAPNRTVTVDIGGTTYYLAAKTTND